MHGRFFQPLDHDAMRAALCLLEGTHDYSSFRAAGGAPMSPVRTLDTIRLTAEGEGRLSLYIHGTGFLYHMVRNIVSTAVAVGTGRISQDRFAESLRHGIVPARAAHGSGRRAVSPRGGL